VRTATVRFEIASFWHAGTGRGAGAELDARSHRSASGLPVLPGRTVRGLFREAMETAVSFSVLKPVAGQDLVVACFGSPVVEGSGDRVSRMEEARFRTREGALVFGSARVGESLAQADAWEAWAGTDEGRARTEHLFRPFASTRLDEDGVAMDGTLRATELVVPLTLVARVEFPREVSGVDWAQALERSARFIRGVGSHRNRGLGRVKVTVEVQP